MRIYLAGIVLFGFLAAGCSSDWDSNGTAAADPALRGDDGEPSVSSATIDARRSSIGFASLPDRGELLSYSKDREQKRRGAYTSHPVEISEEHALNAIAAGGLRLSTPDGRPVNINFDRFEESLDGNWTWVGQNDGGDRALLTFGDSAVFGEIFAGGRSYRVTTGAGGAWLLETDQTMLAGRNPGQHAEGPEFLIPPTADHSATGANVMASAAATAVVPKNSSVVVDLALGYTNGFVASQPGQSQSAAITRLVNLVAFSNAAYQRSGVTMRLRLVNTVQVNFPDATDNADTLQKLTGYNSTTRQFITPDPAFNALRAARDEFGADLVALVRPHRSPEQKGCGIAWLLGSGQTAITAADAPFGYSVVSDGIDSDESDGNTYICSDYSLVHELGHSMGQAHNREDSEYAGAHIYSYGYRESSTTGFHTIMAYPLVNSSQTEIGYFATPLINYASGRPLGVANASDNVRSLNQTMPIVAQFRATVVPMSIAQNDFNGDGYSDVFWRHSVTGVNTVWRSGAFQNRYSPTTVPVVWSIVGTGDFDGDGVTDLLWRHNSTGANVIWRSANSATQIAVTAIPNLAWQVGGIGDFDGDGRADILWRNPATGANTIWRSGNSASVIPVTSLPGAAWTVAGIGDFDGDGKDDVLWRNTSTGVNAIWLSANSATSKAVTRLAGNAWRVAGVGDFNGDGEADILWRNWSTGANAIWRSGESATSVAVTALPLTWSVAAIGDYDRDGASDILWRNTTTGANSIWRAGVSTQSIVLTAVAESQWRVVR